MMREHESAITAKAKRTSKRPATPSERYADLRKSIRTWGIWILLSAILSLLPGFDPSWAAILIIIGGMSFYFSDAAGMLLVYAGTMLWAAFSNVVAAEGAWPLLGVVQVVWAVVAYRGFRKYRGAKAEYEAERRSQMPAGHSLPHREGHMAWLGLILGAIGLVGLCSSIPVSIVIYSLAPNDPNHPGYMALAALFQLGGLGLPVGIAALSMGASPRLAAIAGIVLGALCALVFVFAAIMAAAG